MKNGTNFCVALLFALSLVILPYRAFAFFGVEVGVGSWRQSPSGTLSYQPLAATDTLDLKNDLHFDDKSKVFGRAKLELPLVLPNIYAMATPMSFEGTGSRTVNYGGHSFSGSYSTKLKLDHYDLALYYPIPLLKTATLGKLNVELGLNGRQINYESTLASPTISASKTLTIYVPMVYLGAQVKPVSAFAIEAEIRGITYGSSHYYDYLGRLKITPFGPLFIGAGYRSEQMKIDQSGVKADVKFSGPFVEAGLSF